MCRDYLVFSPLEIYNIKNYYIQLFMFYFRISHLFRIVNAVCGDLEFNIVIIIYADTNYSQIVVLYCIKAKYWMIAYPH